jgi:hypothetical protein
VMPASTWWRQAVGMGRVQGHVTSTGERWQWIGQVTAGSGSGG